MGSMELENGVQLDLGKVLVWCDWQEEQGADSEALNQLRFALQCDCLSKAFVYDVPNLHTVTVSAFDKYIEFLGCQAMTIAIAGTQKYFRFYFRGSLAKMWAKRVPAEKLCEKLYKEGL